MKNIIVSSALIVATQAVKFRDHTFVNTDAAPDIYGPNGENYQNNDPSYDLAQIGIDITHRSEDPKQCATDEWTTVHWEGKLADGTVFTDSRLEGDGLPKTFNLGRQNVLACWDIALKQLHKGDVAEITCPSFYGYGGALTQSPFGFPIPLHANLEYRLEVLDCNRTP